MASLAAVGGVAAVAVGVLFRRAYRTCSTNAFWDPAAQEVRVEHRNLTTVLLVMAARTGLVRSDSAVYQFVARVLTRDFAKADVPFAATGADPVAAIRAFCATHGIAADVDAPTWEWSERPAAYASLNAFFMRRYAGGLAVDATADVVAPATSVFRAFERLDDTACVVKGETYTLDRCGVPAPARYAGRPCFYFYLSPADYHCFHAPVAGVVEAVEDAASPPAAGGHARACSASVKPDTLGRGPSILTHNRRVVVVLRAASGLRVALVILGGFLVDSIRLDLDAVRVGASLAKGQFLGAFALGGSAILLLADRPLAVAPALAAPRPGLAVRVAAGAAFATTS